MTAKEQLNTVGSQAEAALAAGAKIIAQSQPDATDKEWFYPAMLMTGVNHSMEIMREETFGPVLPVMRYRDIEEALRLTNDLTMALTSSIWRRNLSEGRKIDAKLHSGVTTINDHLYTRGQSGTLWGGWKKSELWRRHSHPGLDERTHAKLVNWDLLSPGRDLSWFPLDERTCTVLLKALRHVTLSLCAHG